MNKKYTNHENDDDDDKDGDVDENDMGYVTSGEVINAGVKGRNELIKKYLESREDDEVGVLKKKEMHDGMSNIDSEVGLRFSRVLLSYYYLLSELYFYYTSFILLVLRVIFIVLAISILYKDKHRILNFIEVRSFLKLMFHHQTFLNLLTKVPINK